MMRISDLEYHTRMLFDIATQNKMPLLLCAIPSPSSSETIRCANGDGFDIITMLGMMCVELTSMTPDTTLDEMLDAISEAAHIAQRTFRKDTDDKPQNKGL